MAVAVLVNFNHLSNMRVGTGWPITLGVALCCMFLCLAVRVPLRHALGLPGFLVLAALASYLAIGGGIALFRGIRLPPVYSTLPVHSGLAILIITATALSASAAARRIGVNRLLAGVLGIQAVACALILLSPLLVAHFYVLSPMLEDIASDRLFGTFASPNWAGTAACQAAVLAFALLDSPYRKWAWLVLALASVAVVFTISRTAIIALALVYLFFLWPSTSIPRLKRAFIAGLLGILAIAALAFAMHLTTPTFRPSELERQGAFASDARLQWHWPLAIERIGESPLFGHGMSRFHRLEGGPPLCDGRPCGSHNVYLMLWGEAGIVPAVLFLLFVGSLASARLRLPGSVAVNAVTGWGLVIAVECMTFDSMPYSAWQNFIMGLSCALAGHAKRALRTGKPGMGPGLQNAASAA